MAALLLAACGPEEVTEDRRYEDLSSGGEAGDESASPDAEALAHVRHGLARIREGQCEAALAEGFEPALALFEARAPAGPPRASRVPGAGPGPEWSDTLYLQAFCLVELGRADEASAVLERALAAMPGDVVYACELGHIRQQQGRFDDALALFEGALESAQALGSTPIAASPLFGQRLAWWQGRALRGIGFTQYERGELDAAEAAYRAAIALDPNDRRAIEELQLIATRRGAI